jgi:3-dehydroquinate synthase
MTSPAEPSPGEQRRSVRVDLGPRAYDVLIGRGLLKQIPGLMEERGLKGPFVVITDHRVAQNYRVAWEKILTGAGLEYSFLDVPPGEESKSLTEFSRLLSELAKLKVPRSGTILALGGGVVGDLAGYVAASYLRGIACVQIPTTLLAMVDSSVGGKTGLNLPEGKNLAGAFHQPKLVVADLNTLKTLPAREFSAGMAEVIKYGAIAKRGLFDRVAKGVTAEDADLVGIIETCVAIKARIVEVDEFETGTQRALLNFGHTVGHAIERATGYKVYLHGEAIALGMRAAAWLSVWHAGLPETKARKIEAALSKNGLPVTLKAGVDRGAILAALGNDKKVASDGKNRWVLLNKLGEARGGWELTGDGVEKAVELLY